MSDTILKPTEKRIIGAILVIGAVVVTHMFVVKPMNEKKAKLDAEATTINKAGEDALSKIRNIQNMREEYASISNNIYALTNNYVVRQILGSYPMEQDIYRLAANAKFHVQSCSEFGKIRTPDKPPMQPPVPGTKVAKPKITPPKQHHFDRFQMEVRGEGSYYSIMELIHLLEDQNPFFNVTSLDITEIQGKPEIHNAVIKMEWPVDAAPMPVMKKK